MLGVYEARPGETARPPDRPPVAASGGFHFAYRRDGEEWVPPAVFMDVRNTSDDDLYVCVLDLTDGSAATPCSRPFASPPGTRWRCGTAHRSR